MRRLLADSDFSEELDTFQFFSKQDDVSEQDFANCVYDAIVEKGERQPLSPEV